MEKIDFNEKIYDEYALLSKMLLKIKFLYLKVVNNYSISDEKKDYFHNQIIAVSEENKNHFSMINASVINKLNIDDFEKLEKIYIGERKKKFDKLIKDLTKVQTVKPVDYSDINKINMDGQLNHNPVSQKYSLNEECLKNINLYQNKKKSHNRKEISIELINLKAQDYAKSLSRYEVKNADLFYKLKLKIEEIINTQEMIFDRKNEDSHTISFFEEKKHYILIYNEKHLAVKILCHKPEADKIGLEGEIAMGKNKIDLLINPLDKKETMTAFMKNLSLDTIYDKINNEYKKYKSQMKDKNNNEETIKMMMSQALDDLF